MKTAVLTGINIQWPWSDLIASGTKKIETRGFRIPKKHIGKELAIIETPGPFGKLQGIKRARIIGVMVIESCYEYKSYQDWVKDFPLHKVTKDDPNYSFKEGEPKWAWKIKAAYRIEKPIAPPKARGIVFATNCKLPILR
ncbi:MAG: ASCH domain-containing protein [Bdellovibrionota bacterium]